MNFFSKFSSVAGAASKPPRKASSRPRLVAVWVIDPRTGKPKRVWRAVADREGSSRRRPQGPLPRPHRATPLRRAA